MKGIKSSGFPAIIAQALAEMEDIYGEFSSIDQINLAELGRRTGLSRSKLRRLKKNGFQEKSYTKPQPRKEHILDGYSSVLDSMLRYGVSNSVVCHERLQEMGVTGSCSTVKRYIAAHKHLIPAKRQQVAPQGNRGRRYTTEPGHTYQMDWGFTDVITPDGFVYRVACFAMVCHHCGMRYIEFFPNAKQENLFIGMIHVFQYMGIPLYVLTDNMKSVVIRRDLEGHPVWQKDYESFMKDVGFETKLCKPRHPFTKGKVERLVRFVKDNFLADRVFSNITDLNWQALEWCNAKNDTYRHSVDGIPQLLHSSACSKQLHALPMTDAIRYYLCPERKISFDGFVNYELEETYAVGFDMVLSFDVRNCKPEIDEDDEEILFEDYTESPSCIELEEDCCISTEVVSETDPFYEEPDGERDYATDICPDCGSPIGFENDGGNGFCINCAPNH